MVYLYYGDEQFLVRQWKNEVIEKYCPAKDDMNYLRFEGTSVNVKDIADVASTYPFFASHRVIVCENTELFKKASDISKVIATCPETTILIFSEASIDKKTKAYKEVAKLGIVKEAKPLKSKEASKWGIDYCKGLGCSISQEAVDKLVFLYGTDLFKLHSELNKLASYNESGIISLDDVASISTEEGLDKLFSMLDHIGEQDKQKVFDDFYQLKLLRYDMVKVLNMLVRHVRILMEANAIKDKSKIASLCGVPPFTVSKYVSQSSNFTSARLQEMMEMCLQAKEKAFGGRSSVDAELTKLLTNFVS